MKCPYCKNDLKKGLYRKFETLVDHVMNPNAEDYPFRETYVCSVECEKSENKFWDSYGDFYQMSYIPYDRNFIFEAIGSSSRKFKITCEISRKFYKFVKFLFFWESNGWYFRSEKISEFCVKHNILFGYEL
jgi:hypothetical protein